jgi:hypothetical protein
MIKSRYKNEKARKSIHLRKQYLTLNCSVVAVERVTSIALSPPPRIT